MISVGISFIYDIFMKTSCLHDIVIAYLRLKGFNKIVEVMLYKNHHKRMEGKF